MIAAGIILFALALGIDLLTDYRKWLKQRDVNHKKGMVLRIAMLTPCGLCLTLAHPWALLPAAIITTALVGCMFWLLFDGFYNILRGFGWWYNGSPDGKTDDSLFDRFLRKMTDSVDSFLKIGGAAAFLLIYIISFLKY